MTKETATKTKESAVAEEQPRARQDVAVLQAARLPFHPIYQERYGVDGIMWRALVEAVYPAAKTVEGIILAVSYCRAKGYDIMKKMVHVVPIWNSTLGKEVEGVWEAVSALRATAFRTGLYAGCDATTFGPMKTFHFDDTVGYKDKAKRVVMDIEMPEWAQITVYRLVAGVRCAFPGPRVTYLGAYGCRGKSEIPNDKWGVSGDSYMLEKCAEAAALRKAFPEELGGINAAEEMEGRKVNLAPGPTIDNEPEQEVKPRPTRESVKAEKEAARKEANNLDSQFRATIGGEQIDNTTGEVTNATDGPDPALRGETPHATEAKNQDKPGQTAVATPAVQPKQHDHAKNASMLRKKILGAPNPQALNAIEHDYNDELLAMEEHAPDLYAQVAEGITGKREFFAGNSR